MPISILDPRTIGRIAAGEVIERPSSVVKELVENALDAGSSEINIEVNGGGINFIRVTDNGQGIPAGEVSLAFERHATSKITSLDDLFTITSLGFRGEALPSIAAVADVELFTRVEGEDSGTEVRLAEGEIIDRANRGRARGTTVTVTGLFRRVPARLKFLKSPATENGHVTSVVSQYALAFPEIRFTLKVDGSTVLRTPGTGKLLDGIIEIYGVEIARGMLEIGNSEQEPGRRRPHIQGMISSPEVNRSSRAYLSFFVNRRWVNNRLLSFALEEAYQGLLMKGKHPVAVINITIVPEDLDINVHPTKAEIKFRDERSVFAAIQKAVRQTLVQQMPVPRIEEIAPAYLGMTGNPGRPAGNDNPLPRWDPPATASLSQSLLGVKASLPLLRVLGQLGQTYIVAEGEDGLYLIDQHAAHERIIYEQLKGKKASHNIDVQGLLPPVPLELNSRQMSLMNSRLAGLSAYGFDLEPFGERTLLVRAVPAILRGRNWSLVIQEYLDMASPDNNDRWEQDLLYSLACHGAVRAGQVLTDEEMRDLIRQMEEIDQPQTCPHGRPTVVHLTSVQIRREFGRT